MLRTIMFMLTGVLGIGMHSVLAAEVPLQVQKVTDNVYAIVGEHGQRSPDNLGNNATFGLIVTEDGAVLVDPGGSYKGAQQIHRAIKTVTNQPVKLVINTGGQDHRWLGNGYFKQQDARIIASQAAVEDQQQRGADQLGMLESLVGKAGMAGTQLVHADQTFPERLELSFGGVQLQLHNPGVAHTPGDSYVWLPQQKVMFSGDIVYTERMLTVGGMSNSKSWVAAFETMAALQPRHVIPGHGSATDLARARADTYDYLVALRQGVADLIERGMGLESVSEIDQSKFSYLLLFDDIKGPNAHAVFREMEWE